MKLKDRRRVEQVILLEEEKQVRCGDGTGKITSHSLNCQCKEIDKELVEIEKLR